ncbi:MAG: rod shape-determining protein MreC [Bacteroidales bacterium]|nr:rod shape-determining protein MreC [Bacteroidales bacterium]
MRSLIRFFQKHHILLLFLILEGIAGFMLLRNNYIQRIAFVKATNVVSGSIHEQISNWRDYLYLREQNRQLQDENTKLRNMLAGSFYVADTARTFDAEPDKLRRYAYLPAKVINNTVNKQFNFVTLDCGKDQEVATDMAVIGPEGIVGIVYGVSEHFATVIPVINRNFRVSAKFKKNNLYGSLSWDGRSYRHATLNEISLHVPVSKGDTIVVSGYSDSFPEGIPVGVVDNVEQKDGSFYTIDILLATDFRKLHFVAIVEDLMKEERQKLEHQTSGMQ